MKSKRILIDHNNKVRRYYVGEIHSASPTDKCHRIPVEKYVQDLADNLYRLIQLFNLEFPDCNNIIRQEFGEGVGLQTFFYHFLDRNYGVGFNPRDKTLRKYRYLESFLIKKEKEFAKSRI